LKNSAKPAWVVVWVVFLLLLASSGFADDARVLLFTPQGETRGVRQVRVQFSEQMVPFGTPAQLEPFEISCLEKGRGRWADGNNWVYDFDRDLPAGVLCRFTMKQGLTTLTGNYLAGEQIFSFSTGGPAVRSARPRQGFEHIAEDQIFVLALDAEPTPESVLQHVSCRVEGLAEAITVRTIEGKAREEILKMFRSPGDDRPESYSSAPGSSPPTQE